MRRIAEINGTLRDDEGQCCHNCKSHPLSLSPPICPFPPLCLRFGNIILSALGGVIGHRKYDCPQIRSFNAGIICHRCRQAGHFQRDCKVNLSAQASEYSGGRGASGLAGAVELDKEYQEFLDEIGAGGGGRGYGQSAGRLESGGPNPWQHPQRVASVAPWVHFPPLPSPPLSIFIIFTSPLCLKCDNDV